MHELGSGGHSAPTAHPEVPLARSVDIARRRRIYLIQMGIRLLCFLLLFVVPGWWKAVVLLGAVLLPFTAVLMANDADVRAPALEEEDPSARPRPALAAEAPAPARPSRRIVTVEEDGSVSVREDDADPDGQGS